MGYHQIELKEEDKEKTAQYEKRALGTQKTTIWLKNSIGGIPKND
jgi:hypothetical protein